MRSVWRMFLAAALLSPRMFGPAFVLQGAEPLLQRLLADDVSLASPAELSEAKGVRTVIFRGKQHESGFNLHSYIAYFDGRYWVAWSSSKAGEDDMNQRILYATSTDGHLWSEAKVLAADPDGPEGPQRWIARGLFVDGGKLRAAWRPGGEQRLHQSWQRGGLAKSAVDSVWHGMARNGRKRAHLQTIA